VPTPGKSLSPDGLRLIIVIRQQGIRREHARLARLPVTAAPQEGETCSGLLGGLRGATPNAACDSLYYSAAGDAGGLDLFVATRR